SSAAVLADQLIQKIEDRYNHAQALSVHFIENYSLLGHPRPPESGTLMLRKQGKMRWEYSRPQGKLFISDGKNVFLYTALDNRVEKVPLKDTEDMRAPLAFLLGRLDMKKEFRNFTVRAGEGGTWLDATAKTDRLPYEKVEMLVSDTGTIQKLTVIGRDQSVLSYAFTEERLNPLLSDAVFHFQIPAGAQVIDAVSFKGQEK
ncbi:MAG: outer membrane lipoprotein carrier protein LolA, partial [Acidobacteriaceae bacterium]|nr:outer membrane lipoprotein carrier protein LolA [Acidobacteriaceae bacterium]